MSNNPLYAVALKKAQNLCSKSEKCVSEMEEKLQQWGLNSSEIQTLIQTLINDEFLSNSRYAEAFANDKWKFQKWGRKKISYLLRSNRIENEIIDRALKQVEIEEYKYMMETELQKKNKSIKEADKYKRKQKLMRFAESRGYESNIYSPIISKLIQITAILVVLLAFLFPKTFAQQVIQDDCGRRMSLYKEFINKQYYEEAYPTWREVFDECPQASKNIYIDGAKIMKHYLQKNTTNEAKYGIYLDSLMLVYKQRIEYYQQEAYVNGLIAADLLTFAPHRFAEAYNYAKYSVDNLKEKSDIAFIQIFIQLTDTMYNEKKITENEYIENYISCADWLDAKKVEAKDEAAKSKINWVIENTNKIFTKSNASDCTYLVQNLTPKVTSAPDDLKRIMQAVRLLDEKGCTNTSLYISCVEKQYKLDPSPAAGRSIAKIFASKGETDKAIEYFDKAIGQEKDTYLKSKYLYELATIYYNGQNFELCRKKALEAIELNPNFGKAFLLIGNAYVASANSIGKTDFEHKAVYWAAVDMYAKAKGVDYSVADEVDKNIKLYTPYFPARKEAFFYHVTEGSTYTVGGWVKEKTTARFND